MNRKLLYFGTSGGPGHYFYGPHGSHARSYVGYFPGINVSILERIDGTFTPGFTSEQGKYIVSLVHPVMIVAWHDYTGDKRPGSHCTLIGMGYDNAEQMIDDAYQKYPDFMDRQPRPVYAHGSPSKPTQQ